MCIYTVKKKKIKKKIINSMFQWKNTLYSTCMQHEMPQSLLVFAVSLRRRSLILGRSVESRTPLEDFFYVCILSVYMHIFEI